MLDWVTIQNQGHDYWIRYDLDYTPHDRKGIHAAKGNVEYIQQHYPAPYYLMVSGGVDSQAMLWAWAQYGTNYIPVSFIYNKDMNIHDIETMHEFSSTHIIPVAYKNFDVLGFLENDYPEYSERYRCGSPHICTYMRLVEELPDRGTVIFSGDPWIHEIIHKFPDRNNWGLYKYAIKTGRSMVPYFFTETKQITESFNNIYRPHTVNKVDHYHANGFPVISQANRPPYNMHKYTGFEKIKDYYDENFAHLVTLMDYRKRISNQGSTRVFDLLLRNKYEYQFRKDIYQVATNKILKDQS